MSFRKKVILTAILMIVASVGGTTVFIARGFYYNLVREAELRTVALVDGVAQVARNDLASNSLEGMDAGLTTVRDSREGNVGIVFAVILDRSGRIATREITTGYETLVDNEFITRAGAADAPLRQYVRVGGHNIFLVSTPVQTSITGRHGIRWGTVVGGMDIDRVKANIFPLIVRSMIVAGLFLLIFTVIMIAMVSAGVIWPIRTLTTATERFAAGDMAHRVPVRRLDEIGRLAATFNEMADEIQTHTTNLEETVRERTWELEKANSRLQELAATDELTGLGNRRTFQTALKQEIRRSQRDSLQFALLMLDVDHFKHYNDTHGHPAGDAVLAKLGEIMRNRLRVTDIPCRYGGEEFAAILITTDLDGAIDIAESIRSRVEEEDFFGENKQPLGRLTVSIGVAVFPDDASDPERLVDAADIAMYAAKDQGRNRVIAFTPDMKSKFSPLLAARTDA